MFPNASNEYDSTYIQVSGSFSNQVETVSTRLKIRGGAKVKKKNLREEMS